MSALEPHVSARTLEFHHGKHHKAYVDKLNAAIKGTKLEEQALESIIEAASETGQQGIFNNAAQAWNHTFLWHSMSPAGGGDPAGALADAIKRDFGSIEKFRDAFKQAALGQFGSGWTWLVAKDGRLEIESTGNADTPLTGPGTPLLTLDVWEHAYYLDFQNQRDRYIDAFLSNLVNWDFASRNFDAA
ncbi:MAG: superoxide dismutase [Woeseiaceae bacterium]|nr:superoxide dismutase [Woeseiaceae bacterium]